MKRSFILTIFCLLILKSFAQFGYAYVNFDDTTDLFRIAIDTSVAGNIWQTGSPHKTVFKNAYTAPRAIMTDTLNPYPGNTNSVFYFRTEGDYTSDSHDMLLYFWYQMDCDTLADFGRVDVSLDNGQTWSNILTRENGYISWTVFDSLDNMVETSGSNDTLLFSGKSNGLYHFECYVPLSMSTYDLILFRFTFHSDGSGLSRDGWMIDNILFATTWESVPDQHTGWTAFPNPVKDQLTINSKALITGYEFSDSMGKTVRKSHNDCMPLRINLSDLAPGIYLYKLRFATGREKHGKVIKM